jgi:hypothetical protein
MSTEAKNPLLEADEKDVIVEETVVEKKEEIVEDFKPEKEEVIELFKEDSKDDGEGLEGFKEDTEEVEDSVLSDVEKITGISLDVDFGEVHPDTPEGVAMYVEASRDNAVAEFEELLKEKAPNAYKAMLIESDGGDPAKFFVNSDSNVSPYIGIEIKEDNTKLQEDIVIASFKEQGYNDEHINIIVQNYKDSNKLHEASLDSQKRLKESDDKRREEYEKSVTASKAEQVEQQTKFIRGLEEVVDKGVLGDFQIPKADKEAFVKHILPNIQHVGGDNFMLVKPIASENLSDLLQSEFFSFKGGNLEKLVKRKVGTEKTKSLRRKISKDKKDINDSRSSGSSSNFADL